MSNDKSHGYNETNPVINVDKYGRLIPAVNRFPSSAEERGFKPLADYIHDQCTVRDLWAQKNVGEFKGDFIVRKESWSEAAED